METENVVISRASMRQKIVEEEDRSGSRRVSDPGTTSTSLGDSDLACLRKKFPFLAEFSDEFVRSRPTETLLKMETTSIKMKELEKGRDIDDKLSSNKMELEDTFTEVKAGKDNRSSILHAARFLAGAACASTKLWRRARQVIGLTGHPPVGSYDLAAVGLAGYVSKKGWVEAANPASPKIRLQQFSIISCTAKSKNNSNEEKEGDIQELPEFKLALRAMRVAFCFVRPWDHSILALEGFFEQTQYCEKETGSLDNRAGILTKFVNYCLGQNADRWRDGEGYLTTGELVIHWASFVGAMPLSSKSKQAKDKKQEKTEVKRKWVDICFPWNSGNCLKAVGDCKSAKGTNLRHVCNYIPDRSKPDVYCGKDHPRTSFHK
jgi:hypothetical protein